MIISALVIAALGAYLLLAVYFTARMLQQVYFSNTNSKLSHSLTESNNLLTITLIVLAGLGWPAMMSKGRKTDL